MNMRKVISLLVIYAVLAISSVPSHAQFQNPSPNLIFSPAAVSVTATCTTTGCPTFTLPAVCTATVRLSGTNSAISILAQISNDGGANYSTVFPTIPSTGVSSPGVNGVVTTATGAMTQGGTAAAGLYVIQVPTMNRIRFIVGTLTGTNVVIKLVATSVCNGATL
jgi:hypothetical protein